MLCVILTAKILKIVFIQSANQIPIFLQVVDIETRQKLGPNQKGEICIKGPVVMKGYAGNKSATRDILDNERYLKTGDIGYYDEDGTFFIVDRLKELIKYKGSQVRMYTSHKTLQTPVKSNRNFVGVMNDNMKFSISPGLNVWVDLFSYGLFCNIVYTVE